MHSGPRETKCELLRGHSALFGLTWLTCKEQMKALGSGEGEGQLRRTQGHKHYGSRKIQSVYSLFLLLLGWDILDSDFLLPFFPITPIICANADRDTNLESALASKAKVDLNHPGASRHSR